MLTQASSTPACWSRWITFAGWLLSLAVHAAYPDAVLTDRPTGYWKLTDLNSVTAVANAGSSGAGSAGQRSGSVQLGVPGLTTDTAAAFDGAPAQFAVPFNLAHNRYYFSVEAWVRLPNVPSVDRCVLSSIDLGATGGFQLLITATGKWQFLTGRNGLGGDWEALEVPATTATSWTHLVAQYDGTNKLFYVNGLLVAAARSPFFPNPTQPLRLGADTSGLRPFLGTLAHVAVYDRALTAGAVGRHYTAGTGLSPSTTVPPQILVPPTPLAPVAAGATVTLSVVAGGSAPLTYQWRKDGVSISGATTPLLTLGNFQAAQEGNYTVTVKNALGTQTSAAVALHLPPPLTYRQVILSDTPYAYWALGETNGATVVRDDAPASSTHPSYPGQPGGSVGWEVPGIVSSPDSSGARFIGRMSSNVEIANQGAFASQRFSVELWVRLSYYAGRYTSPLSLRESLPTRGGFAFFLNPGGEWQLWTGRGDQNTWDVLPGPLAQQDQWCHLAATYDGHTKCFYVNGQRVATSTLPYFGGNTPLLQLGTGANGGEVESFFEGDLDEVAFYQYPLPADRVAAHAGAGRPAPDTTAPRLLVASPTSIVATGPNGALVHLEVVANDANDGIVPVTLDPPGDQIFPLGETNVRATAHDAAGNTNTLSFTVNVIDATPPTFQLPNTFLELTTPDGAWMTTPVLAFDEVDGSVPVTLTPPLGTFVTKGVQTFVAEATDRAGNRARVEFDVSVFDRQAPVLQLPADITVRASSLGGTLVQFEVTATDFSPPVFLIASPSSGSIFPIGTTQVHVTAIDLVNNISGGGFNVTVLPPELLISPASQSVTVGEGGVAQAQGTLSWVSAMGEPRISTSAGTVELNANSMTWRWTWTAGASSLTPIVQLVTAFDISSTVAANIEVLVQNLPPVTRAISRTLSRDYLPESITLEATDPGGDPMTYQITKVPPAWKGSVSLVNGNTARFSPANGFRGVASFEYTATDDEGAVSAPATVSIFSSAPDQSPTAYPTNTLTSRDQPLTITLPADDPDLDVLTYQVLAPPTHGTLTGVPPQLTYTPAPGYQGVDQFLFSVSDGLLTSNPATVTVQVQGAALIGTRSFTNATALLIGPVGPASPYGTPIQVAGLGGKISRVTVQLRGFSHTLPDDVDMLLVGPTGRKAIVFSDVGGTTPVTGLDLTLADAATVALPDATLLTSGTFKPLNYGTGDSFNAPAPVGPYLAALNQFNNSIPNGTWTLYVMDDAANNSGVLAGGWLLTITTVAGVGVASVDEPAPALTLLPESLRSSLRVRVDGAQPGGAYMLEASRDLEVWTPRWQGLATDTAFEVDAGPEPDAATGFFRLRRVDAEAE